MDHTQIWEAIRNVVESGNEDDEVDLKSEWYDLDSRDGKAEFVKDVCAMANGLSGPGDRRYLVCGVLDSRQWPDRADVAGYVRGVQPGDVDGINQTISQSVKTHIEPRIDVQYVEIQHPPEVDRTLGVVRIRGWSGRDDRPYVIATGIGSVKKSQVFVRSLGGLSEPADRSDIQLLVSCALQERIEYLEREREELERKAEAELNRQREEFEDELLTTVEDLRNDKQRLSSEAEKQREFARALCRRFYQYLDDTNRRSLRKLAQRYDMDEDVDSWVASQGSSRSILLDVARSAYE